MPKASHFFANAESAELEYGVASMLHRCVVFIVFYLLLLRHFPIFFKKSASTLFVDVDGGIVVGHDFAVHRHPPGAEGGRYIGCGAVAIVGDGDLHIGVGK